ncbi:hypothetical protein O6H91_07G076700 [Diphasiastrum complanatum]|uniref:Uncharacterized protein n=2 Tax=Diphasiastrum complanatum TaxID=34168 RepID=A0ACC2C9I9_DIPCM|nr:hypothetical protein O6H91_11G060800 [Diphasiastrum complanatum]KAJ7549974.1 hypothetical protein O6H91_07G076700 [Diphasiastrum complanatum]
MFKVTEVAFRSFYLDLCSLIGRRRSRLVGSERANLSYNMAVQIFFPSQNLALRKLNAIQLLTTTSFAASELEEHTFADDENDIAGIYNPDAVEVLCLVESFLLLVCQQLLQPHCVIENCPFYIQS